MTKAKIEKMTEMLAAAGVPESEMLQQVDALLRSMGVEPATIVFTKER